MKLVIKNYGAIKEGMIDLSKRFFLFVGYNNTGKTYLAKLIYDIFNVENIQEFATSHYNKFKPKEQNALVLNDNVIKSLLNNFATYLKEVVVFKTLKISSDNAFIVKDLDISFEYTLEEVKKAELNSGAKIGFDVLNNDYETKIEIYSLKKEHNSLEVKFEYFTDEDIYKKLPKDFFDNVPKKRFEEQIKSVKKDISKTFIVSLLNLLLQNKEKPFFLPSNRIFILENAEELSRQENLRKKELSEILVEIMDSKDKDKTKQKLLSNMLAKRSESEHTIHIAYLIDEILKLRSNKDDDYIKNGTGFYNSLISSLSDILGGEIIMVKPSSVSNWVERFQISKRNSKIGNPIKLNLASSSVNQLSTLFLFFKYWAKSENNFLIIDEPEENLHPESQIQLISLLLEFVNTENRLLITTHSPLVAEIINNYLILGQLENNNELIHDFNLPNIHIEPQNTQIYFFNNDTIVEHKIGDFGTIFTSFKMSQDKIYQLGDILGELMYKQLNKSK